MPESVNLDHNVAVEHHNQLVQSYLDSLLSDITEVVAGENVARTENGNTQPQRQSIDTRSPVTGSPPALSEEEYSEPDTTIVDAALVAPVKDQPGDEPEVTFESRPDWAEETFASLLFEVAGNDLAAPLHELGGICPLTDNLKFLAGQADWFLGLLNWNGRQLRVVDTARLLMSETHLENSLEEDYQSVIILGNSNWALAVNRADQSVRLDSQDVKWRKHRGNRHWLAGTLQVQLSSLIDVSVLRQQLDTMDESLNPVLEKGNGTNPASDR